MTLTVSKIPVQAFCEISLSLGLSGISLILGPELWAFREEERSGGEAPFSSRRIGCPMSSRRVPGPVSRGGLPEVVSAKHLHCPLTPAPFVDPCPEIGL